MKTRLVTDTHRWLLGFAVAYLALLPTNSATFVRSVAFAGAAAFALIVFAQAWRGSTTRVPFAGRYVLVPLSVWALWSAASYGWSVRPRYSLLQLEREVMDSLIAMFVFYIAARGARAVRVLITAALAAFFVFALLAIAMLATHSTGDASLHHHGVGPYSTWVVIAAPLLFAL